MARRARTFRMLVVASALLAMSFVAGCSKKTDTTDTAASAQETKGWDLRGQIVAVNKDRGTLTVHHEEIPGLMPSMTMEFKVSSGDLANAKPGQRIKGWLYRSGDDFILEKIWPDDDADRAAVETASEALQQDTAARGSNPYREVGEKAPDFTLYDQDGRVVQASRFQGRKIVLNFIYTRCPDPKMCPASTTRMMAMQAEAKKEGIKNVEFISITLDPKYDTPGVLHDYAEARGIDTSNFSFLTGPESAVKNLMAQLGIVAFEKGGLVTHSLATLLIDGNGRIIHREEGSGWPMEPFIARLKGA